jgi:hypothetical protein
VIELAVNGAQAGFDVAETLAKSQLRKSETKELIEAREAATSGIAAVPLDALLELVGREVIHQLGENQTADLHASLSDPIQRQPQGGQNRRQKFKSQNLRRPPILLTPLTLLTAPEAIAGH